MTSNIERLRYLLICSPVSGVVKYLDNADTNKHFGVYICSSKGIRQDSCKIFAPFDAYIRDIKARNFSISGQHYSINPSKRSSFIVTFEHYNGTKVRTTSTEPEIVIILEIEIGSGYLTNEIDFSPVLDQFVISGMPLGNIKPGSSFARISIIGAQNPRVTTHIGQILRGGSSSLAAI